MKDRAKKLIKNTTILSIGTLCTKGLMFIMTPFFTRWLSQTDYGIFDLVVTYVALLIPIITLEIGQAAFRFLMKKENENKIISNVIFVSIAGIIISILLLLIISCLYGKIKKMMISIILLIISETFYNALSMIMRGIKKIKIYTISNIIYMVSMAFFVFLLVYCFDKGINGIINGYAIGYLVSDIFMGVNLIKEKQLSISSFDLKKLKEMIKYSLPLIPCDMAWWIMSSADRTIVSIFLGTSYNSIISVAHKLPNVCQSIFSVFHLSWQENAIETMNDDDKNEYISSVMNNMVKIISSICIVILSLSFIIFKFLFTKDYFMSYYQVPILILSIIIATVAQFLGSIYIANMNSKKTGLTTLIASIVNIIVHVCLIKKIGLYAASISTFISYMFLFIIRYIDIRKKIQLKFTKESKSMLLLLLYFVITSYINNIFIIYANMIIAIMVFIATNWKFILKLKR